MAVQHPPESNYAKEMWRWDHTVGESNPHDPSIRGLRPVSPAEFPKMLYQAARTDKGPIVIASRRVAGDAHEQRNLESRGFHVRQEDALAAFHADDLELSKLAANRAYQERTMSEAAQREAAAVDAETDAHVPVIPETPVRRGPGRPRKTETV